MNAISELISINLLKCYCLLILLHGYESSQLSHTDMKRLDNCINLAVMKIFGLSHYANFVYVHKMCGLSILRSIIEIRT